MTPLADTPWRIAAATITLVMATALLLPAQINVLASSLLLVLPAMLMLRGKGYRWRTVFRLHPVSYPLLFLAVPAGVALSVLGGAIDTGVQLVAPMPDAWRARLEQSVVMDSPSGLAFRFFALVVVSSVCEELFFRGFLQSALENRYPWGTAIVLTCLLFSAAHINLWWFPSLFFTGLTLGVVVFACDSVLPGIVAHAAHNAFSFAMANVQKTQSLHEPDDPIRHPMTVAAAASVLTMILIHFVKRRFPRS
ncbi:MAG: CPBP family intramembrane metalloprotease [candidate division Zixibacteria bacterium]|nr:CPBP family intramembrane metalloprotease [candidate division Zixibacteria bacterium]